MIENDGFKVAHGLSSTKLSSGSQ